MKKLSRFDLIIIIVFVVIGLLGGGAWYYLSDQLGAAQANVSAADSDFNKYSKSEVYLPNKANEKILQDDIDQIKGMLDPLVQAKLRQDGNKIFSAVRQGTVDWKHDLDNRVQQLNKAAKVHGVTVPPDFYYSFSKFRSQNPDEEKTVVLTKQLLGIEQIATILINAPVKSIQTVRRTYEENEYLGNNSGSSTEEGMDKDFLGGHAINVDGGIYTDYPFQIEFQATTDTLRQVVNGLIQSPYVFVIRNLTIKNSRDTSPLVTDLDKLAAPPPGADTSPGGVAAAEKTVRGPQYLFGAEFLQITLRVDMIEWSGVATAAAQAPEEPSAPPPRRPAPAPTGDN